MSRLAIAALWSALALTTPRLDDWRYGAAFNRVQQGPRKTPHRSNTGVAQAKRQKQKRNRK